MPPQVTGSGTCFATLCTHVWLIFIVYNANMSLHISLLFERSVTHWTQIIHRHRQTWKYKRKQITNIANSIWTYPNQTTLNTILAGGWTVSGGREVGDQLINRFKMYQYCYRFTCLTSNPYIPSMKTTKPNDSKWYFYKMFRAQIWHDVVQDIDFDFN